MRLAKFLAQAGIASRRGAEDLIRAGKVTVNGKIHRELGQQIDEVNDEVVYKGQRVAAETHVYYAVHKPVGYVCSRRRQKGEQLVTDLVPPEPRVYPVGRLDKESSGLVILTNDGQYALRMTHPRYQIAKTYVVEVERPLTPDVINSLKRGVKLSEGKARVDSLKKLSQRRVEVVIHQGWNRQLRRMLGKLGYTVMSLQRIAEGEVELGTIKVGTYLRFEPQRSSKKTKR